MKEEITKAVVIDMDGNFIKNIRIINGLPLSENDFIFIDKNLWKEFDEEWTILHA